MKFERVYTVTDYYDGPRGGVADFEGRPHVYESSWDDSAQEFTPYRLMPISDETLDLALEDWAIWRRWEDAHIEGLVTIESHPALPVDRARHELLAPLLAERLRIDPARSFVATAEFRALPNSLFRGVIRPLEVRWERPR